MKISRKESDYIFENLVVHLPHSTSKLTSKDFHDDMNEVYLGQVHDLRKFIKHTHEGVKKVKRNES